ncbi:hypothetical protein RSAG8_10216, partial [Rhizoctonia solani AG-8 WAC10335]
MALLKGIAKKKKEETTEKANQMACNEREGHLAQQAAPTTFTQGHKNPPSPCLSPQEIIHNEESIHDNESADSPAVDHEMSSYGSSNLSDPVIEALNNATEAENAQHETLLGAIVENSESIMELTRVCRKLLNHR